MTTGIIFPSHATDVTYTPVSGGWSADYPLSNATRLTEPSNVAMAASVGARTISGVFPAARSVSALALVGHKAVSGNLRIYLFSGTGNDPAADAGTLLHDSGSIPFWPSGSAAVEGYRSTRPYLVGQTLSVRSFRIVMDAALVPHELAGIEIGTLWSWPGISPGRELGVRAETDRTDYVGGASSVQGKGAPIIMRGSIDLMKMAITQTTGLDFQAHTDKRRPFVWAEDFEDAATWARKCLLVRNEDLPPSVGALYRHDRFQLRLVEHLR